MPSKLTRPLTLIPLAILLLITLIAAIPHQGLPNPAIFQGTASIGDQPAPEGTTLIACVADPECEKTNSNTDTVQADGKFIALTATGTDHNQIGSATVYFFIVNDHGRVQANETAVYGSSDPTQLFFQVTLTFPSLPTPVPTPTPTPVATPTPTPPPTPTPTPTPVPTPPPTPTPPPPPETALPIPGEPLVPQLAQTILYIGITLLVLGTATLLYTRRRLN